MQKYIEWRELKGKWELSHVSTGSINISTDVRILSLFFLFFCLTQITEHLKYEFRRRLSYSHTTSTLPMSFHRRRWWWWWWSENLCANCVESKRDEERTTAVAAAAIVTYKWQEEEKNSSHEKWENFNIQIGLLVIFCWSTSSNVCLSFFHCTSGGRCICCSFFSSRLSLSYWNSIHPKMVSLHRYSLHVPSKLMYTYTKHSFKSCSTSDIFIHIEIRSHTRTIHHSISF